MTGSAFASYRGAGRRHDGFPLFFRAFFDLGGFQDDGRDTFRPRRPKTLPRHSQDAPSPKTPQESENEAKTESNWL